MSKRIARERLRPFRFFFYSQAHPEKYTLMATLKGGGDSMEWYNDTLHTAR